MAPFGTLRNAPGVGEDSTRRRKKRRQTTLRSPADRASTPGTPEQRAQTQEYLDAVIPRRGGDRFVSQESTRGGGTNAATTGSVDPLADIPYATPLTPFGQQYSGDMYETLFANPQVLADKYLSTAGLTPQGSGGMYDVYQQLSQVMPPLWYLTQTTGQQGGELGQFLDFANAFMNQMSTPGGGAIDPSVIANLFSAGEGSGLYDMLNDPTATPEQQAQRLLGLMSAGMSGLAPGIASGRMGNMSALANQWLNEQASRPLAQRGTFVDFLDRLGIDEQFR